MERNRLCYKELNTILVGVNTILNNSPLTIQMAPNIVNTKSYAIPKKTEII